MRDHDPESTDPLPDPDADPEGEHAAKGVLSASASAVAGAFGAAARALRVGGGKGRAGYNCCEYCGARLPRDPTHSWSYSATCAKCGRAQP